MLVDKIQKLYLKELLSTWEIAQRLGITQWRVISIMRRKNIPRRTAAETNRIKFLKSPLSYSKKANLSLREKLLHQAGIMLYWAEGAKMYEQTVDFTNSDQDMVKLFLTMLRVIYKVDESRLRVLLYCYANQSTNKLLSYWSNLLQIPLSQFIKPYVRQDFDLSKINKMPYGLAHIRYSDKRLLVEIKKEIGIICSKLTLSQGGGVDNRTSL